MTIMCGLQVDSMYANRVDAKNIVLLFTDGASNINPEQTIPLAIKARQEGAHIIVFGVIWKFSNSKI